MTWGLRNRRLDRKRRDDARGRIEQGKASYIQGESDAAVAVAGVLWRMEKESN
jgi:hypothetical protein